MRKKIGSLLIIFALLSMTACNKETDVKTDIDSNNIEGKIEIWSSEVSKGIVDRYVNSFKEVQSKVVINNTYVNETEFGKKLSESLSSGIRMPDIMIVNEASINKFKSIENKVTITPWYITPRAMFYRRDLFSEANIKVEDIKTWNDYIEAGKRITENTNGKVRLLPLSVSRDSGFFRQLVNQLGGSYYDKEGKIYLSSEAAVKSMTVIKSIYASNVFYNYSSKEDIIAGMKNNEIVTIPFSTDIILEMRDKLNEQSGKWGIMNMPAFEPGGMIASAENKIYMIINKDTAHNKASAELKAFMQTNKELEREFIVNKGLFPVASQLYDEPFVDEADTYFSGQKIWRYLVSITKDTPDFPVYEKLNELKPEIIRAQESIVLENRDISSTLKDLEKQINEIKTKN